MTTRGDAATAFLKFSCFPAFLISVQPVATTTNVGDGAPIGNLRFSAEGDHRCTAPRASTTAKVLDEIRESGLWKNERIITSPQGAEIDVTAPGGRAAARP